MFYFSTKSEILYQMCNIKIKLMSKVTIFKYINVTVKQKFVFIQLGIDPHPDISLGTSMDFISQNVKMLDP